MTTWVDNSQKLNETNINKMRVSFKGVYPPSDFAGHGIQVLEIAIPGYWIFGTNNELTTPENAVLFVKALQEKAIEATRTHVNK